MANSPEYPTTPNTPPWTDDEPEIPDYLDFKLKIVFAFRLLSGVLIGQDVIYEQNKGQDDFSLGNLWHQAGGIFEKLDPSLKQNAKEFQLNIGLTTVNGDTEPYAKLREYLWKSNSDYKQLVEKVAKCSDGENTKQHDLPLDVTMVLLS